MRFTVILHCLLMTTNFILENILNYDEVFLWPSEAYTLPDKEYKKLKFYYKGLNIENDNTKTTKTITESKPITRQPKARLLTAGFSGTQFRQQVTDIGT